MIRAIAVDDEIRSLKLLLNLLKEHCPQVQVVGTAQTVDQAFQLLTQMKPDVLFLDIQMQGETGFDLLSKIQDIPCDVIFITAHENYALKAIKFSALDYLLKPIDIEELKIAVGKIGMNNKTTQLNLKIKSFLSNLNLNSSESFQIALATSEGLSILQIQDIIYLRSDRQYTFFILRSGEKIMTSKNLGEYEELLLSHHFFRIHHSLIINLKEVKKFMKGDGGSVLMSNGDILEIAKRKKDLFLKQFQRK